MKFKNFSALLLIAGLILLGGQIFAEPSGVIKLPKVAISKSITLSDAITKRSSSREYTDKEVSLQHLSNILWCANGINRADSGYRTYPSAKGRQSISVYVILKQGAYLYNYKNNTLELIAAGDFMAKAGTQAFVAKAPLNLIYVADISKLGPMNADNVALANLDAGHCSENVYLYCAGAGLSNVIRASVDTAALGKILKLTKNDVIIAGHTIGYSK